MSHRDKRRRIEARGTMPSKKAIKEYWAPRLWRDKGFDSLAEFLDGDCCFACGFDNNGSATERAHILALCLGGDNKPSNLHCLCSVCHKNSEHLQGDEYWQWFNKRTIMDRLVSTAAQNGANLWTLLSGSR